MKKLFFVIALAFAVADGYSQIGIGVGTWGSGIGISVPTNMNSGRQRGKIIDSQVQRMKSDLNLNDDQVVKLRSLLVERDRRREGKTPMTMKELDDRLAEILTDEQYHKFSEWRSQKQQQIDRDSTKEIYKPHPPKDEWDDLFR